MTKKIDGICFKNMIDYAVRNLNNHRKFVNRLNVFPVPDGDTGTNMVATIHRGLTAVGDSIVDLPSVARKFAQAVVFEARGNSGVIVSQFLKGISEKFYNVDVVEGELFIEALENGVRYAYSSVTMPVEGTMLTVIKDATETVKKEFNKEQSVGEIIDSFIEYAKRSLENTPELLSVLKENGVVDSGGAGIVYLFEGMKKYLDGEVLDAFETNTETINIDYDVFNRNSHFKYGYCTEVLLQLLNAKETFEYTIFKAQLLKLGDSVVMSIENDKVRIHIHTRFPENVFALCHRYGEFLSAKIENMSVQHTEPDKRILCSEISNDGTFSIVAVAYDTHIQKLFAKMGADVVICANENNVSTRDYLDAFEKSPTDNIIVFPNSSDAILSAVQAKKLYKKAGITILNSRTIAECYAALPVVDFENGDVENVTDSIVDVINNLLVVSVAKRNTTVHYRDKIIHQNEFYSFFGKELIIINRSLEATVLQTIKKIVCKHKKEIVTIFHQLGVDETVNTIIDSAKQQGVYAEFFTVAAESLPCLMTISFE